MGARLFWILERGPVLLVTVAGCNSRDAERSANGDLLPAADTVDCGAAAVRTVVERFGQQLQRVSLLAPESLRAEQMRESYGPFVAPDLLAAWLRDPHHAPGRQTSSPWPDRIEISSVESDDGTCTVRGDIIYATSVELSEGGAAAREPVVVQVRRDGAWQISGFALADSTALNSSSDAVDVVRGYYAAIAAHDYAAAYALWADEGAASGQTLQAFAAGFRETADVRVETDEPARTEGAAGSVYVHVPVTILAVTTRGERQRFQGTYTLRRSSVDGASEAQRSWRIHSADIRRSGN